MPGCIKVFADGTVGKEHALPREISYSPGPAGPGTWMYKPVGEIVEEAVREVGVVNGTHEPGNNRNPGIVPIVGRRVGDPKGVDQGVGATLDDRRAGMVGERVDD